MHVEHQDVARGDEEAVVEADRGAADGHDGLAQTGAVRNVRVAREGYHQFPRENLVAGVGLGLNQLAPVQDAGYPLDAAHELHDFGGGRIERGVAGETHHVVFHLNVDGQLGEPRAESKVGAHAVLQREVLDGLLDRIRPLIFLLGDHALDDAGGGFHAHVPEIEDDVIVARIRPIFPVEAAHPLLALVVDLLDVLHGLLSRDAELSNGCTNTIGQRCDEPNTQHAGKSTEQERPRQPVIDRVAFGHVPREGRLNGEHVILFLASEPRPQPRRVLEPFRDLLFGNAVGLRCVDDDLTTDDFVSEFPTDQFGQLSTAAERSSRDRDDGHASAFPEPCTTRYPEPCRRRPRRRWLYNPTAQRRRAQAAWWKSETAVCSS